jgi:hypothetical protein
MGTAIQFMTGRRGAPKKEPRRRNLSVTTSVSGPSLLTEFAAGGSAFVEMKTEVEKKFTDA